MEASENLVETNLQACYFLLLGRGENKSIFHAIREDRQQNSGKKWLTGKWECDTCGNLKFEISHLNIEMIREGREMMHMQKGPWPCKRDIYKKPDICYFTVLQPKIATFSQEKKKILEKSTQLSRKWTLSTVNKS